MKKLFTAIHQGDTETVISLLDKKPELIACTAKAPPKKDAGQSPLQVAIKSGHSALAHLLLDRGADVNFMEAEDCGNEWRMPVVQDAIRAAVMCARYNSRWPDGYHVSHTQAQADAAFALLERMVILGADLTAKDSGGLSSLDRALLDTKQILPAFHYSDQHYMEDRLLTPELESDLNRIFRLLMDASTDVTQHIIAPDSKESLAMQFLLANGGLRYQPHRYDDVNRKWIPVQE